MSTTSKEERSKILAKKSEISRTKEVYRTKLDILNRRGYALRNKSSMRNAVGFGSTQKALDEVDELNAVNEEITKLKKERDEKINSLKEELDTLRKNYQKNYEKYKKQDKEAVSAKIADAKIFIKEHKYILIGVSAFFLLIFLGCIGAITDSNSTLEEYDIKGLTVKEACEKVRGAGWTVDGVHHIEDYSDKTDCYNESIIVTDYYYMGYDNSVTIYYGERKTEEEKKAECEAKGYWYRNSQCKSQEEWENDYKWQDAHSACKKYGPNAYAKTLTDCYVGSDYMGTVDGQPKDDSAENSPEKTSNEQPNSSSSSDTTYRWKQFNSDGSCSNDAKLCVSIDESYGYASYGYGNVKGRVYNNSGENAQYMQISFSIYNATGAKIGDCFDNTNGLNAGTTWSYDAYCTGWSNGATVSDVDISWW